MTKIDAEIQNPSVEAAPEQTPKRQIKPLDVDMAEIIKEAEMRGREAYRAEVLEISRICKFSDMPEKLADFVGKKISLDAAKDELMQILVTQNQHGKSDIHSSVEALPATEKPKESSVVATAKARAKAAS